MNTFYIVLITLVVYSLVSTIVFIITKENEDITMGFGLGIVGLILIGITKTIRKIRNSFKYHIGKRSIFIEEKTGNKYKCKTRDTNDVCWVIGYSLIKRYATKSEWQNISDFSKEFIKNSKRNCDNCKYNDSCKFNMCRKSLDTIRCQHDSFGIVTEFDKFEKNNK